MNLLTQETCPPSDDTRLIPLTQGQFAIVDAADFEWLNQWKWQIVRSQNTQSPYARRTVYKPVKRGILMARFICGLGHDDAQMVDHINRNTLDNRRHNLRIVNNYQNAWNMRINNRNKSGFKGVSWNKEQKKWRVRITVNNHRILVGDFKELEVAARARLEAASKYHGEFARG